MNMTNAVKQKQVPAGLPYCVPLRMKALVGRLEMIRAASDDWFRILTSRRSITRLHHWPNDCLLLYSIQRAS